MKLKKILVHENLQKKIKIHEIGAILMVLSKYFLKMDAILVLIILLRWMNNSVNNGEQEKLQYQLD